MDLRGLGGPGSGQIGMQPGIRPMSPMQPGIRPAFGGLADWIAFQGAGGFGMGPYGYPLAYGISPWGQQNQQLSQQWGWNGVGHETRQQW